MNDVLFIIVNIVMIYLSHFAITLMPTNGCLHGHACQVHSGGTCSKFYISAALARRHRLPAEV